MIRELAEINYQKIFLKNCLQSKNLDKKLNVPDKDITIGNGEKVTGTYYLVKELQFDNVKTN